MDFIFRSSIQTQSFDTTDHYDNFYIFTTQKLILMK
jgi:hypothetical protein